MSQKVLIDDVEYKISGGKVLIGGKKYKIVSGKTLISGNVLKIYLSHDLGIPVYITGSTSFLGQHFSGVTINGVEYTEGDGTKATTVMPGDKISASGLLIVNGSMISSNGGVYTVTEGITKISINLAVQSLKSIVQITTE